MAQAQRVGCEDCHGRCRIAPPGEDVKEPVYGAPARWIWAADQEAAVLAGRFVAMRPMR